ncbi:MAG: hypothetical protein HGA45_18825 [Chloroflexales bacterium]|nr:hypothetical protein [Chloroflexales bacterium]
MQAIRRWWDRSVLNKITLLMSFSLIFCCCGWTGRVGGDAPDRAASSASPRESPSHRAPGW